MSPLRCVPSSYEHVPATLSLCRFVPRYVVSPPRRNTSLLHYVPVDLCPCYVVSPGRTSVSLLR